MPSKQTIIAIMSLTNKQTLQSCLIYQGSFVKKEKNTLDDIAVSEMYIIIELFVFLCNFMYSNLTSVFSI